MSATAPRRIQPTELASRRRWASISDRRRTPRNRPARFAGRLRFPCRRPPPNQRIVAWRKPDHAKRSISSLESTMSNRIAPKLLAEFIGTFAFVFIGAGTAAVVGEGIGMPGIVAIAFAHGLAIMAFAFAYGSVSGGHFNPAVSVGVFAAGAMGVGEAIGYIVSQFVGGIVGPVFLSAVLGRRGDWPRHACTRAKPRSGHHDPHGHAGCRLHDRGRTRLFPGYSRTQHGGCGPRQQPRT